MQPMKKICIALDYSPTSREVVETGYEYAQALNAEVVLVHVISDASYYTSGQDTYLGYEGFGLINNVNLVADLKRSSQEYLSTVAGHLGNSKIETAVIEGDVSNAILKFATTWQADLLVLGTHGRNFLENIFMGNTAVDIVKNASIPLLVVPVKKEENEEL